MCVLGTLLYDKGINEQKRSFQNVNLNVSQQKKKKIVLRSSQDVCCTSVATFNG